MLNNVKWVLKLRSCKLSKWKTVTWSIEFTLAGENGAFVGKGDGPLFGGDQHIDSQFITASPYFRRREIVGSEASCRDHDGLWADGLEEKLGVGC